MIGKRNSRRLLGLAYLMVLVVSPLSGICAEEAKKPLDPSRWEKDIQAFEAKDKESFPAKGGIVFVGSSSIRMWDIAKFFPDLSAVNRGFGGSFMEDSVYYAKRIVIPYEPKIIVLYAGDNDIASGKKPEAICEDFKEFVKIIHDALPKTRIVYIPIKPSIKRWALVEPMRETNRLIREYIQRDNQLDYVDIDTPMIGEDGKPRQSLFLDDGLHLNEEGYKLWTDKLLPYLNK